VGKLEIDLRGAFKNVDLLSFSGHKLHAPKGVGVLYIRRGTPCRPYLLGGHQEDGRRAGTENVAFIVGLARALELAMASRSEDVPRITAMRDRMQEELVERIPYLEVNGGDGPRLDNTLNVACHFIEGEGILYQLSEHCICASSGSACTSGSLEPSHVLRAMKVPFTAVHGSVRFSLSRYNTDSEIDRVIEVFPEIVASLRRLSPYWDAEKNQPRPEGLEMLEQTEMPQASA
jgi:cysteine desulfurase